MHTHVSSLVGEKHTYSQVLDVAIPLSIRIVKLYEEISLIRAQ